MESNLENLERRKNPLRFRLAFCKVTKPCGIWFAKKWTFICKFTRDIDVSKWKQETCHIYPDSRPFISPLRVLRVKFYSMATI
jgi:hypothetical protein